MDTHATEEQCFLHGPYFELGQLVGVARVLSWKEAAVQRGLEHRSKGVAML
jgi:hypothetical protein